MAVPSSTGVPAPAAVDPAAPVVVEPFSTNVATSVVVPLSCMVPKLVKSVSTEPDGASNGTLLQPLRPTNKQAVSTANVRPIHEAREVGGGMYGATIRGIKDTTSMELEGYGDR